MAALSLPHICALYVGPNYGVMELVDGVPLAGPLPPEQAVEYAAQILEALAAAHQQGIAHRDLKPAPVFRPDRRPGRFSATLREPSGHRSLRL